MPQPQSSSTIPNKPIHLPPKPVKSDILAQELVGYDKDLKEIIVSGFKLGILGNLTNRFSKNYKSALENPQQGYEKLAKEAPKLKSGWPVQKHPF